MLVKTHDRWKAARALLNTLLKDKTMYCNICGQVYDINFFPCCEEPQIGRHIDHLKGVIKENKWVRNTRKNDLAQMDSKTFRWAISLPPGVLREWERMFKNTYNEKLLRDNKDLHKMMKEFPQFTIPRRI